MGGPFSIYKYTSPSGKSYIGQTKDLRRRAYIHRTSQRCRAFAAAIARYGFDAFKCEILCSGLSQEEANEREASLIAAHNTLSPTGYNLRAGGNGSPPSAESLERMRATQSSKSIEWREKIAKAMTGKSLGPGVAQKGAASRTGGKRSAETKAKMAESRRAYWDRRRAESGGTISSPLKGVPKSEETKKKLSDAQRAFQAKKRAAT